MLFGGLFPALLLTELGEAEACTGVDGSLTSAIVLLDVQQATVFALDEVPVATVVEVAAGPVDVAPLMRKGKKLKCVIENIFWNYIIN